MVQLWVNLPAKDKMSPAGYQGSPTPTFRSSPCGWTSQDHRGRISRCSWTGTHVHVRQSARDLRLQQGADLTLTLPAGHNAMIAVLTGQVVINGTQTAGEAEIVRLGATAAI